MQKYNPFFEQAGYSLWGVVAMSVGRRGDTPPRSFLG